MRGGETFGAKYGLEYMTIFRHVDAYAPLVDLSFHYKHSFMVCTPRIDIIYRPTEAAK